MPLLAALFFLQVASASPPAPSPTPSTPPCFVPDESGGAPTMRYVGDRACIDFGPNRTISGIWVDAFEGSAFYENARSLSDIRGRPDSVWLTLDEASVTPPDFKPAIRYPAHAYRLTFVGRTAKDMHRKPLSGYGHFGMSSGLVLVDRVTEWSDMGPFQGG